jgi:hypothetical protein
MFSLIPWDVRCAGVLLIATLIAIFESMPIIFVALYAMLCAYIVVSTFNGEGEGEP